MSMLTDLLQANQAAHEAALLAMREKRWDDGTRHFQEGAYTVGGIVRYWVAHHEPTDESSWVSFYDVDGCDVALRWRDGVLVATGDNGPAIYGEWHEGSDEAETVRYERYVADGRRVGHGYVHPTTRKLVQSG